MAKGKRKRRRPGHGSAPPSAEAILAELDARTRELADADPAQAGPIWGATHKLLLKAAADPGEAARLIATRDLDGLERLRRSLHGEEPAASDGPPDAADADDATTPAIDVPPETMKKAMRAFRRRLKLVRLDHESRLGVGPMTGGRKADVDAILAPREFEAEVWAALVAAGQLRFVGQGFYMLAEEQPGS